LVAVSTRRVVDPVAMFDVRFFVLKRPLPNQSLEYWYGRRKLRIERLQGRSLSTQQKCDVGPDPGMIVLRDVYESDRRIDLSNDGFWCGVLGFQLH
jgi:hypothetical protein